MNYDALADLYSLQYQHYRDDIDFYWRLAERLGANKVLELGAGQGRVSIPLARRGLEITGLDLSEHMLARGRDNAAAEKLNISFLHGDMREFNVNKKWPLVIAPFNALMHLYSLDEQDQCMRCVHKHLEPSGVFAFDLYRPNFAAQNTLRHEGETFLLPDGRRKDVMLYQRIETVSQLAHTTYFVDTIEVDGALHRQILELKQRYFTRYELSRWFAMHGFRLELHGDFDGARLTESSPFFVGVARKTD